MHWQNATITRIEKLSPRVKSFFFRLPEPISFRPGQHVLLRLTAPDGYRAQRSYSIASAPGTGKPRSSNSRLKGSMTARSHHSCMMPRRWTMKSS